MLRTLKLFLFCLIAIPVLDFLWLGLVMNSFYMKEMGPLARNSGHGFEPMLLPAVGVYVLIAVGVLVFVLPRASSVRSAFTWGACNGLILYGVYDLTNLSVTQGYSFPLALVDIAWGTCLCAVVAAMTYRVQQSLR